MESYFSVQTCRPVKTARRRARQLAPLIAIIAAQGPAVVRRAQNITPEEKVRMLYSSGTFFSRRLFILFYLFKHFVAYSTVTQEISMHTKKQYEKYTTGD